MRCRRSWCGIKDLPTPPTGKIKLCSSSAHVLFCFCPFFFCKDIPANQNCLSLSSWLHSPGQTRSFFKNRFSRCLFCFVPYLLDSLSCCIFFMVEWLLAFLWLNTFLFMHAVVSKVFFFFFFVYQWAAVVPLMVTSYRRHRHTRWNVSSERFGHANMCPRHDGILSKVCRVCRTMLTIPPFDKLSIHPNFSWGF